MAITTRIAPMYAGQKMFAAVLCAVFGVWGAYDYAIKIPQQEAVFAEFEEITARLKSLEGQTPTPELIAQATADTERLNVIAPGGTQPIKPSKFNRATQWVYIACLPFAPWFFWLFLKAKRQNYRLDDDGTLHFQGDPEMQAGSWAQNEIVDIDMDRWMAKSIAHAVHADGRRLKLDAYIHRDLHLIVGAIASRLYPDKWDAEAKMVKASAEQPETEPAATT